MERILNQSHNKETFVYVCSRGFERASYYGLRSIMTLYMVGATINLPREEVSAIYGLFIGSFIISNIIGAVLGDLLLGNKKALIIGGILQALGAFSFCIPSITGVYAGLVLVVLGGGMYTPNLLSLFGKNYINRVKQLDSGFTILYLAINLGAFLGPLCISFMDEEYYTYGFIISGVFMLFAVMILLFLKENKPPENNNAGISFNSKLLNIIIALVLIGLFWTIYEIGYNRVIDLEMKFTQLSTLQIPASMLYMLSSLFVLPIGIIAAILWSFYYSSQFVKLTTGFIAAALSYAVLFFIPDVPADQHLLFYLFSFLLMGIAEIHVSPIIYSVLTRYSNPKYLAIIMSLSFVPIKLFGFLASFFNSSFRSNPMYALSFALISVLTIGIALWIYIVVIKKNTDKTPDTIGQN